MFLLEKGLNFEVMLFNIFIIEIVIKVELVIIKFVYEKVEIIGGILNSFL